MSRDLSELEEKIGYKFKDRKLLINALTHSSFINESKETDISDNERLEFFGDAIIEFFISEFIFNKHKDFPEGDMTKMRASMVCEPSLAACARYIDLGDYIIMGRGEEMSGGRSRDSIISDAFEALVAAIYLDSGWSSVADFIGEHLEKSLENEELFFDAKTRLQEIVQKTEGNVLRYEMVGEEGPAHNRTFEAVALLNDEEIGHGQGHSKKEAQQKAAMSAIKMLRGKN